MTPRSNKRKPEVAPSRMPSAAVLAASGTLLAGVAAVLAIFIHPDAGGGAPSQPSSKATTSTQPAHPAGSFREVGSRLADFASKAVPNSEGPYTQGNQVLASQQGDVELQVPQEWSDTEDTNWLNDGGRDIGEAILASPGIDGIYDGYLTPGIFVGASPATVTPQELLASRTDRRARSCTSEGQGGLDGQGYTGDYAIWSHCGGGSMVILDVAANPSAGSGTLWVHARVAGKRDAEAVARALATLDTDFAGVKAEIGNTSPGLLLD